jgi:hypothetical protein
MNTTRITYALIATAIAVVALAVANVRTTVDVDGLIGFGAVLAILALAAADYRFAVRRVFGGR